MSDKGHIEIDRRIDAIIVGVRHRQDLGNLDDLVQSIKDIGLLQPITITPDGLLVCGWRRLEAVRRLGWRTLKVWVRSGISDRLSELLAQQDENALREPLTQLEESRLFTELQKLKKEDAGRRQEASQFGAVENLGGVNGAGHCPAPRGAGDSRAEAARLITGTQSYHRFERIAWLERIASDPMRPTAIRELARAELKVIEAGGPVMPGYSKVKAAIELGATELHTAESVEALGVAALARIREQNPGKATPKPQPGHPAAPKPRTLRAFILTWTELDGWSMHYDAMEVAEALKDDEWERFERVVAETVAFAESLRSARSLLVPA